MKMIKLWCIAKMGQMFVITSFILFELGYCTNQFCIDSQSLQLGHQGIITCSFEDGYGLYWYDSVDLTKPPILFNVNRQKGGFGYTSGDYDLAPGGSLIIRNVTIQHEQIYVVVFVETVISESIQHEVVVKVIAYPSLPYPVIDRCVSNIVKQHCYSLITYNDTISCEVTNSRPSVHLTWLMKTPSNESDVTRDRSYSPIGDLNTTVATMRFQLSFGVRFYLFICESDSTTVLRNLSSFILAEVNEGRMKFDYVVAVKTQIGSMLTLPCDGVASLFVLWKIIMTNGKNRIIGYVYDGVEYSESPYILHQNGSLMFQFNEEHVDLYLCITTTGSREESTAYEVTFDTPTTSDASISTNKIIIIAVVGSVIGLVVTTGIIFFAVRLGKSRGSVKEDIGENSPEAQLPFIPPARLRVDQQKSDDSVKDDMRESSTQESMEINSRVDKPTGDEQKVRSAVQIKHYLLVAKDSNREEKVVVVIEATECKNEYLEIDWTLFEQWNGVNYKCRSREYQEMKMGIEKHIYKFDRTLSTINSINFTFIVIRTTARKEEHAIHFKDITENLIYISTTCDKYKLKNLHAVLVVRRFHKTLPNSVDRHFKHPILRLFGNDLNDKVYLILATEFSHEYRGYKISNELRKECNNVLESIEKEHAVSFERSIEVLKMRQELTEKVASINKSIYELFTFKSSVKKVEERLTKLYNSYEYNTNEREGRIYQQEKVLTELRKDIKLKSLNIDTHMKPLEDILSRINPMSLFPSYLTLGGSNNETHITESMDREIPFEKFWTEIAFMLDLKQ